MYGNVAFKGLYGSCAVRTLDLVVGNQVSSEIVLEVCKKRGFRSNQGMYEYNILQASQDLGIKSEQMYNLSDEFYNRPVRYFCENNQNGIYRISTSDHTFLVINGIPIDTSNTNNSPMKSKVRSISKIHNSPVRIEQKDFTDPDAYIFCPYNTMNGMRKNSDNYLLARKINLHWPRCKHSTIRLPIKVSDLSILTDKNISKKEILHFVKHKKIFVTNEHIWDLYPDQSKEIG